MKMKENCHTNFKLLITFIVKDEDYVYIYLF